MKPKTLSFEQTKDDVLHASVSCYRSSNSEKQQTLIQTLRQRNCSHRLRCLTPIIFVLTFFKPKKRPTDCPTLVWLQCFQHADEWLMCQVHLLPCFKATQPNRLCCCSVPQLNTRGVIQLYIDKCIPQREREDCVCETVSLPHHRSSSEDHNHLMTALRFKTYVNSLLSTKLKIS